MTDSNLSLVPGARNGVHGSPFTVRCSPFVVQVGSSQQRVGRDVFGRAHVISVRPAGVAWLWLGGGHKSPMGPIGPIGPIGPMPEPLALLVTLNRAHKLRTVNPA